MKELFIDKIAMPLLKLETWRLKRARVRIERDIKVLQYELKETNSQIDESLEILDMHKEKCSQGKTK